MVVLPSADGDAAGTSDAELVWLSGPAMEESLHETTIRNFPRLLERPELAAGILAVGNSYLGDRGLSLRSSTIVDATLINETSSTKNKDNKRDPEMHQTKRGNQNYSGMKAHNGDENVVCADAGYTGVKKCAEPDGRDVIWQVAVRRSMYKNSIIAACKRKIEKAKAQLRAKV
jgi:IS5 family transposase